MSEHEELAWSHRKWVTPFLLDQADGVEDSKKSCGMTDPFCSRPTIPNPNACPVSPPASSPR